MFLDMAERFEKLELLYLGNTGNFHLNLGNFWAHHRITKYMQQKCFIQCWLNSMFCIIGLCLKLTAICLFPSQIRKSHACEVIPVAMLFCDVLFYSKPLAHVHRQKTNKQKQPNRACLFSNWGFWNTMVCLNMQFQISLSSHLQFLTWARSLVRSQLCSSLHHIFHSQKPLNKDLT